MPLGEIFSGRWCPNVALRHPRFRGEDEALAPHARTNVPENASFFLTSSQEESRGLLRGPLGETTLAESAP
jgi:hypothetical protein